LGSLFVTILPLIVCSHTDLTLSVLCLCLQDGEGLIQPLASSAASYAPHLHVQARPQPKLAKTICAVIVLCSSKVEPRRAQVVCTLRCVHSVQLVTTVHMLTLCTLTHTHIHTHLHTHTYTHTYIHIRTLTNTLTNTHTHTFVHTHTHRN